MVTMERSTTRDIIRHIDVLDHGYVRLKTWTPCDMVGLTEAVRDGDLEQARLIIDNGDLTEVNAARASYGKASEALNDKDRSLIGFLASAEPVPHTSPFRHAHISFEINAPLPVARQWWRHAIGAGTTEDGTPWSELSRRYVRGGITYHVPAVWRSKAANSKQGSGAPVDVEVQVAATDVFVRHCDGAVRAYDFLIGENIAPEQARLVLPQGVFTSWVWTPSMQALTNFLTHRLAPDTQWETREFAKAVYQISRTVFPEAVDAFVDPAQFA